MAVTTGQISYPVMQVFIINKPMKENIWHLERNGSKRFNKNAMMYFSINNIFNHRDDDRATQERVYTSGG